MRALIIYASWTGHTKRIAEALAEALSLREVAVTVAECQQKDASAFTDYAIAVVCTYTYGSKGSLPEEIEDFYYDLETINLTGRIYAVLGSGEKIYGYYCKAVDDFEAQFKKTGAQRGAASLKIELGPDREDLKAIAQLADQLVKAASERSLLLE